jgi:hypothetical protein
MSWAAKTQVTSSGAGILTTLAATLLPCAILEREQPTWINQGCAAHGVSLAMKDFCSLTKTGGRFSKTFGCDWMQEVTSNANTIANHVNDSGNAKGFVHKHMKELSGKPKTIAVNVPTRFATNLFVMKSVLAAKAALVHAASDLEWQKLGGKAEEVQGIICDSECWANLHHATRFLQPFSDFIHQIEADQPLLGRCYEGLMVLHRHVHASIKKWSTHPVLKSEGKRVLMTWERRLQNEHDNKVQVLLNPSHIAAYLLDPLYAASATVGDGMQMPIVPEKHEKLARELIQRVGGVAASVQFDELSMAGYNGILAGKVRFCAAKSSAGARLGEKREREEVASITTRKGCWKRYLGGT